MEELAERDLSLDMLVGLEGLMGGQRIDSLGPLDCSGQRLESLGRLDLQGGSLESMSRQLLGSLGSLPEGVGQPAGHKDMVPAHSLGAVPSASGPLPSLEPLPTGAGRPSAALWGGCCCHGSFAGKVVSCRRVPFAHTCATACVTSCRSRFARHGSDWRLGLPL